jgi:ribosomal-protein-alanine N-acetyltransferase
VTVIVGEPDAGVVEPMRWWDIEQVAALEQVLFPTDSPWTPAMFWSELAAGHHYVVYRSRSRSEAGPSSRSGRPGERSAERAVGYRSRSRREAGPSSLSGYAGLAVAGGLPVLLEVRCDNGPAIALYESEGFARIGVRRHYYQPSGADAYTMLRPGGAR